jgi:nicotinamidase-related amidase
MRSLTLTQGDALLIVDVQKDFLPGGALGVPRSDHLIPVINAYVERFATAGLPVYASRDWHPPQHCSFRDRGGPWPPHCIAGSPGAEFGEELELPPDTRIISKATDAARDAYSAFDHTTLAAELRAKGVERVFICGLATEYCVLSSTEDAIRLGFSVVLLNDAIGAIENHPGDGGRAISKMTREGAVLVSLDQF